MEANRVPLGSLQEDEPIRAFRELVAEVIPEVQVRLQAEAKAQDYLKWLRQREDRGEVRK